MKVRSFCIALVFAVASMVTTSARAGFPGGNGKIVFSSVRSIDGGDTSSTDLDIFTMDPNGSNLTQLTLNSTTDIEPQWSPDGTKIAFASDQTGDFEIYVMDANGGNVTQLSANPADDQQPAWSPDGTKIVFTSNRTGTYQLFVMRAADADANFVGDRLHRITTKGGTWPRWSPNGKRIAFERDVNGVSDIFKMKPAREGKHNRPRNLTRDPSSDSQLDWSPDSLKIVFRSNRDGDQEIFTMGADGSVVTQLTHDDTHLDYTPAWSPDGTKIVFAKIGAPVDIYTMDANGDNPTNVTNDALNDATPDWQPTP